MVPPAPDARAARAIAPPFELSLCRLRSPLPGNGISRAEKKAPIRRPNHLSAVSETKRSYKNPANSGPFSTATGDLRNRRTGWWAREDSNLQPDRYEPAALAIELRADRAALGGSARRSNAARATIARGRATALKSATYMQSVLGGLLLMPSNLVKSRYIFF
jgi:hypothetical protein